jgi:hypothetical protein
MPDILISIAKARHPQTLGKYGGEEFFGMIFLFA